MDFCKTFGISYSKFLMLKRASHYVNGNQYRKQCIKTIFRGF